jgi:hypothetical protein
MNFRSFEHVKTDLSAPAIEQFVPDGVVLAHKAEALFASDGQSRRAPELSASVMGVSIRVRAEKWCLESQSLVNEDFIVNLVPDFAWQSEEAFLEQSVGTSLFPGRRLGARVTDLVQGARLLVIGKTDA